MNRGIKSKINGTPETEKYYNLKCLIHIRIIG